MAALAANRLRQADRAAIVIDLGTAIKVDVVTSDGAFAGGAILPGLEMSARALDEQTDALPRVAVDLMVRAAGGLGQEHGAGDCSGSILGSRGRDPRACRTVRNRFWAVSGRVCVWWRSRNWLLTS